MFVNCFLQNCPSQSITGVETLHFMMITLPIKILAIGSYLVYMLLLYQNREQIWDQIEHSRGYQQHPGTGQRRRNQSNTRYDHYIIFRSIKIFRQSHVASEIPRIFGEHKNDFAIIELVFRFLPAAQRLSLTEQFLLSLKTFSHFWLRRPLLI